MPSRTRSQPERAFDDRHIAMYPRGDVARVVESPDDGSDEHRPRAAAGRSTRRLERHVGDAGEERVYMARRPMHRPFGV